MGVDLAARLTTGRPMPDDFDPGLGPVNVVIVSAEDDWEDTIAPRLIAAGADMTRVFNLDDVSLPEDCERLQTTLEELSARFLIIDPLVAFVPAKFDLYKDQTARAVLKPLGKVAAAGACAILGLRHINKATGQIAQDRGTGSVAIGGAARSNLLVGPDPDLDGCYALAPIKVNVGHKRRPIGYRIDSKNVDTDDGLTSSVSAIAWLGEVDLSAEDLVAQGRQGEATTFLKNALAHGPVSAKDLQKQAEAVGLTWAGAVRRASERMPISKAPDGFKGEWMWTLRTRTTVYNSAESTARTPATVVHQEPHLYTDVQPSLEDTGRNGAEPTSFADTFARQQADAWASLDGAELASRVSPDDDV